MGLKYKPNTPLAIFCYNRPDLLEQILSQIEKLHVTTLFVISDGPNPKIKGDIVKVNSCRELIKNLDSVENIVRLYREVNLGIYRNIIEGIEFIFSQTDKCIFLEDDTLPDITFFRFCDEMLAKYEDNQKIMMIQGAPTMMPVIMRSITKDSYFFSSYPSIAWGWATWRDKWQKYYDGDLKNWPLGTQQKKLLRSIGSRREYRFWAEQWNRVKATMRTWDYQIMFAFFSYGLIAVVPKDNLVKNIGFNRSDATHAAGPSNWERLPLEQSAFPLKHPSRLTANLKYDKLRKNYVAPSFQRRGLHKLKRSLLNRQFKKWMQERITVHIKHLKLGNFGRP